MTVASLLASAAIAFSDVATVGPGAHILTPGNGRAHRSRIGVTRGKARSWSVAQDRRRAKKARNVRRARARAS